MQSRIIYYSIPELPNIGKNLQHRIEFLYNTSKVDEFRRKKISKTINCSYMINKG